MRFRLDQLVCFSFIASGLLLANQAQAAVSQPSEDQQLQQVIAQTKALEQEVSELSAEVKQLKQQKYAAQKRAVSRKKAAARKTYASAAPNGTTKPPVPAHTETQRLTQGVTVTTSPLLGIRSSFDSSDLLVNLSTMNEDLRLLQQRQQLKQELAKEGEPAVWEDRALLELSGGIEAQAFDSHPYTGPSSTDIDLTRGELDALAYISKDVLGLMSFTYDNSPLPSNIEGSGERFANSRVILRRGFITIGNLDITPIYFSIGQMYAPFGSYSSQIVTTPLPLPVGKINQRIALLGFSKDGVYGSVYGFKGDTNVESTGIDNGGVNLGYKYSGTGPVSGVNIGAGGIVNIADALGMQATGASAQFFQGFGMNSTTEELDHRVPGLNVHGEVDISKFNFLGEYSGATKAFSADNLSMNIRLRN